MRDINVTERKFMTEIIELIRSEGRAGAGTAIDPLRTTIELWTKDGHKLAEYDPMGENWFVPEGKSRVVIGKGQLSPVVTTEARLAKLEKVHDALAQIFLELRNMPEVVAPAVIADRISDTISEIMGWSKDDSEEVTATSLLGMKSILTCELSEGDSLGFRESRYAGRCLIVDMSDYPGGGIESIKVHDYADDVDKDSTHLPRCLGSIKNYRQLFKLDGSKLAQYRQDDGEDK